MRRLLFSLLPRNLVSRCFGIFASLRVPILSGLIRDGFARIYRLDESEMEHPRRSYPTLQALFTRRLEAGARVPAEARIISPVDGRLSQSGSLPPDGEMIQAKGRRYDLTGLLEDAAWAERYTGGRYDTLYLAPFDYHRIHAPMTGRVIRVRQVPGTLWPVAEWSVRDVERLFCVNERIITELEDDDGHRALVVKVGATNVGRISLAFSDWVGNDPRVKQTRDMTPDPSVHLKKGDELGCFELGSTVVLVRDAFLASLAEPADVSDRPIRMGLAI